MGIKDILGDKIQVVEKIETWEKAIEIGAQPLINSGKIKFGYVKSMIENIKNLGPYIILIPGVAMPHTAVIFIINSSLIFLFYFNFLL